MENITQGTIYLVTKCAPANKRAELTEQAKNEDEITVLQYLMKNCDLNDNDKAYLLGLLQ